MAYDIEMIRSFYASYSANVDRIKKNVGRPLTLAEKILYAHLCGGENHVKDYVRGEDYVNFRPDRVAMQDATAQMALLQFMNAGKEKSVVPATVHCDHLIQAYKGRNSDLPVACEANKEVYGFCFAMILSMFLINCSFCELFHKGISSFPQSSIIPIGLTLLTLS